MKPFHWLLPTLAVLWAQQPLSLPGATSTAEVPTKDLPAAVETGLGIQDTGTDILVPLQEAVAKIKSPAGESAPSIAKLADALSSGPDPDALLEKLVPSVEVGPNTSSPFRAPSWKWGTFADHMTLSSTMINLAKSLQKSDPERAKRFCQAGILLAAMDDFQNGWVGLAQLNQSKDEMQSLLGLSDDDFAKLVRIFDDRITTLQIISREVTDATTAIDLITAAPEAPVDVAQTREILAHLDTAFRKGPDQLGYRWDLISKSSALMNLCRARKSDQGMAAVTAELSEWARDFSNPDIKRWIGQAETREGPPPGLYNDFSVRLPDGTMKTFTAADPEYKQYKDFLDRARQGKK